LLKLVKPIVRSHYKEFISAGNLVFDVGANIGDLSQIFSDLGAYVIAIEPQSYCVEILEKRFKANGNVKILEMGVSDLVGSAPFYISQNYHTTSTFSEKWKTGRFKSYSWDAQYDVTMITLDEMVQRFGVPGFCKIDVEGFELEVIKGLSVPISYLSFEFTSEFLEDAKKGAEHLESLGKVEFNFAFGDNLSTKPKLAMEEWLNSQLLFVELNQIPSSLLWGDIYARYSLP